MLFNLLTSVKAVPEKPFTSIAFLSFFDIKLPPSGTFTILNIFSFALFKSKTTLLCSNTSLSFLNVPRIQNTISLVLINYF